MSRRLENDLKCIRDPQIVCHANCRWRLDFTAADRTEYFDEAAGELPPSYSSEYMEGGKYYGQEVRSRMLKLLGNICYRRRR